MAGVGYSTFVTNLYSEVENKAPYTLTILRQEVLRQLRSLQGIRTLFMEGTATFTISTAAPFNGEYVTAVGASTTVGFPKNVLEIDQVWREVNSVKYEVEGPVTMDQIRFYWSDYRAFQGELLGATPRYWCWFDNKLWFAPKLGSNTTVSMDYLQDATRDETTGNEITTASTTQTNPWFDRGEPALHTATLAALFAHPQLLDTSKAQAMLSLSNAYITDLKAEGRLRKGGVRQMAFCL